MVGELSRVERAESGDEKDAVDNFSRSSKMDSSDATASV